MKTASIRLLLLSASLCGCGDDAPNRVDASVEIDAAVVALDCPSYCDEIQANCTGANAQYADRDHCMATCASFTVGASAVTDTSGNTLGCRIYHAGAPAKMTPATHCPHAGPAGDALAATAPAGCSGGDICQSFCALEIRACGSQDAPLAGDPRDANNNHLYQYRNITTCLSACASIDKTHAYSPSATGDSLACRLAHATSAAIAVMPNGVDNCASTASFANDACDGVAMP